MEIHEIKTKKKSKGQKNSSTNISFPALKDSPDKKKRKKSSAAWISNHLRDKYVRLAHKEGMLSRSAYKLIEINDKYRILKNGINIVDLGSAPGGWMQVIWNKLASRNTKLVGIDLLPIKYKEMIDLDKWSNNINFLEGDFRLKELQEDMLSFLDNKIDLIVSDISPNTTGRQNADHLIIMALAEEIRDFVIQNLSVGGNFVIKIFQGNEHIEFVKGLKTYFDKVSFCKPKSSQQKSSEVYIVALGKKDV